MMKLLAPLLHFPPKADTAGNNEYTFHKFKFFIYNNYKTIKKQLSAFITIIVAVIAFILGYFFPKNGNLSDRGIEAESSFYMTSNLSCKIIESSSKDEIGRQISFINLDSEEPKVMFGDSSGAGPMKKIYETKDTLVIQLVASGTGSLDSFVIDKNTGTFSRAAVGSLGGVYSIASKGNCK